MKFLTRSASLILCSVLFSPALKGQAKKDSLRRKPMDTLVNAPTTIQLKEVVIKGNLPVKMKGDTVSYNAGAFKTRVNSTVQDLLKKLPGIQIDPEGRLSFLGKGIEKIYINGKDYYLNDPKLITQNLTSDMIELVEVFDNRSKQSLLSGIKDTDPAKAINLKLKKGVNLDFTGKVYGGYGTRKGYGIGATGTSFVKGRAVIGSLSSNNINNLTEESVIPFSSIGRSGSDKAALQYSNNGGKQLRANLDYQGSNRRHENQRASTTRQTFLADSSLLENNTDQTIGKNGRHHLRGTWELTIDSTGLLNVESSLSLSNSNDKSRDTLWGQITRSGGQYTGSSGNTNNSSSSNQFDFSNSMQYSHRFNKRTVSVNLSQTDMRGDYKGAFNSVLRLYAPGGDVLETRSTNQHYSQANRHNEYIAGVSTSEQLQAGHILNVEYQYQVTTDKNNKQSYNFNPLSGNYDLVDSLTTGDFSNGTAKHRANLAFVRNAERLNFSLGITFEETTLRNSDAYRNTRFKRAFTTLLPSASFGYHVTYPAGTRRFGAEYTVNSRQPNSYQLQPVTDNQNPMQLTSGNPDLKQELVHQLSLNYSNLNVKSMRNFSMGFMGGYEQHSIITATEILAGGVQKISFVNMEGKYSLASNAAYQVPLGKGKKGRFKFSLESEYENSPALLNGSPLVLRAVNTRQKTEFWYRAWDKLELTAEGRLAWQVSRYSEKPDLNSSGLIQNYKLQMGLDLPLNMLLKSDYSLQLIGEQAGLAASNISVWNASLLKNILKSGRGELKVSAFDILNSNRGFYQRVAPGLIQQNSSNVLGRLILLSFIYHLRKVPQDKEEG